MRYRISELLAEHSQKYHTSILAHAVLQDGELPTCDIPILTLKQRREMAEDADWYGEGAYDADKLMRESDEEIAKAYIYAQKDYVYSQLGL